jgi:hypothetical protein
MPRPTPIDLHPAEEDEVGVRRLDLRHDGGVVLLADADPVVGDDLSLPAGRIMGSVLQSCEKVW